MNDGLLLGHLLQAISFAGVPGKAVEIVGILNRISRNKFVSRRAQDLAKLVGVLVLGRRDQGGRSIRGGWKSNWSPEGPLVGEGEDPPAAGASGLD